MNSGVPAGKEKERPAAGGSRPLPAAWLLLLNCSLCCAAAAATPAVASSALQSEMAYPWFIGFCREGLDSPAGVAAGEAAFR
jgi:hypothetical protein